jgi:NADPH-dependent F420 reductase
MKIGIVGATGAFGKGLALRWAGKHTLYLGSRSQDKAEKAAADYRAQLDSRGASQIIGTTIRESIEQGDVVVLSVKHDHLDPILRENAGAFRNKIVLTPIVSLKKEKSFIYVPPPAGSAALHIQKALTESMVVAALHTIPAHRLQKVTDRIEGDVPVCGDTAEARRRIMGLIEEIENLKPIEAGPLEVSKQIEPIVPLILNLKLFGKKKNTSIKFL